MSALTSGRYEMAKANGARRVVVTGMGVVTPIGTTVADFWAGMRAGKSGVSGSADFRSKT